MAHVVGMSRFLHIQASRRFLWNCICIISMLTFGVGAAPSTKTKDILIGRGTIGRAVTGYCSAEIALSNTGHGSGYISSPGYPLRYPNHAYCRWNITAPPNERIFLKIQEGRLEDSKDCKYDYLELIDGAGADNVTLGVFCGIVEKRLYYSSTNRIFVTFSSDDSIAESGFRLQYSLKEYHNFKLDCNYSVISHNGTVTSPGFPKKYPDNCDCWIHIQMPTPQGRIQLIFDVLLLENPKGCSNDYIEIFDGITTESDILGRFCNKKPDNEVNIVSSTQHILLHFHSDTARSNRGFSLRFSYYEKNNVEKSTSPLIPRCPVIGSNEVGWVSSPGYPNLYPSDSRCHFILEAPESHYILLTFEDIDIESDDACAFDYVDARDGSVVDAPLLAHLCGHKTEEYIVATSSNALFLQFVSDGFMEFRGFKAQYRVLHLTLDEDGEPIDDGGENDGNIDHVDDEDYREATEWLDHQEKHDGTLPLIVLQPQNATLAAGKSHMLHCTVNGSKSAIVWLKDNNFISDSTGLVEQNIVILDNNSLVISHMNIDAEGLYTCVVLSEFGALSFSAWIILDMSWEDSCNIEFKQRPVDTSMSEGEDTFLTCFAQNADIFWLKDGEALELTDEVHMLTENIVLLTDVSANNSGTYACQAISKSNSCSKTVEANVTIYPMQNIDEACGKPQMGFSSMPFDSRGRVVSGHAVEKGSFPWQAMLWEKWASSFCGGSLLSNRWVVTAAHCITEFHQRFIRLLKIENLFVRLGKHDQTITETHEKIVGVRKILVHPNFNRTTYDRDVALLHLSETVIFTRYLIPVCLPNLDYFKMNIYEENNVRGVVSGWGMVTERGSSPVYLQAVYLPMVKWSVCRDSTHYPVTENMFCAGYERKVMGDACHGDSGGPFTVKYHDRWFLIGLVSWGEGCDREGKYGFYTRISSVVHWIKSVISDVEV